MPKKNVNINYENLKKIVEAAFKHRRKKLKHNLKSIINVINEQKETINEEYKVIRKQEIDFVKSLSSKYGAGKLDLDTGVFIPNE